MFTRDLYQHYLRPKMSDREGLLVTRSVILLVVVAGVLIGASDLLKLIISYSFLAFAFRADAMLVPVLVALLGDNVGLRSKGAGIGAVVAGMATNLFWNLRIEQGGAAVFIGLLGSILGLLGGHALSLALRNERAIPQPGVYLD
jgi:solute:Na+ symporter, SSS family